MDLDPVRRAGDSENDNVVLTTVNNKFVSAINEYRD
jgi:hypothetical protein